MGQYKRDGQWFDNVKPTPFEIEFLEIVKRDEEGSVSEADGLPLPTLRDIPTPNVGDEVLVQPEDNPNLFITYRVVSREFTFEKDQEFEAISGKLTLYVEQPVD